MDTKKEEKKQSLFTSAKTRKVWRATTGAGTLLIGHGLSMTSYHAQDIKVPNISWKNTNSSGFNYDSLYKSGSIDPTLPANPDDLLKKPGWRETTHPEAGKKEHRTFENKETGEQYRYDQGRPGETGHEAHDHWHRLKPNGKGGFEYLDGKGNPIPKGHDKAHIYSGD